MKTRLFLLLSLLLLCVVNAIAQAVDTTGLADNPLFVEPRLDTLLNVYNVLYGALVIVWGYVGKALNLKAKVGNFVFVVLAGGVVLAGAFIAFGFAKAFPLALTFLSAIGIYDILFKPIEAAVIKKK